jgi:predicted ATP-grasp superfamily ATP-dependent carboligase
MSACTDSHAHAIDARHAYFAAPRAADLSSSLDMTSSRVLITDGETRACLAAARGLAAAGFAVISAAPDRQVAAVHWSRVVKRRIRTPDPLADELGFVAALEDAVSSGDVDVLMPGSDASLLNVSRGRARLEPHVRIGLPPADAVWRSLDKAELSEAATRCELAPPETVVCHGSDEALGAGRALGYPVVVKPLRSVIESSPVRRRSGSLPAATPADLTAIVDMLGNDVLVQRRAVGVLVSFGGVFAGGRLLGEAVSRYGRTWHPSAGNASFSETVDGSPELRSRVCALMTDLGWEGLFELELIERDDGGWYAIDMNPRPYGSMALAIGAGCNLPAIWCRHVLGEPVQATRAQAGVRYRWTDADLRHGLWQLRRGHPVAAARTMSPHRHVVHAFARRSDPGPGVARMVEMGTAALGRARGRRADASSPPSESAVIIGAGPCGLAAAAHLRAYGVQARVFGEPLEFWSERMPEGMLLRSLRRSSNIADPRRELTIADYEGAEGRALRSPSLTREQFIDYGRWFARQVAPDLDTRRVSAVASSGTGFRLRLADGDELAASQVIVAAGLVPFMYRPEPFTSLSAAVMSHAYDHDDLGGFAGRRVAVIGSGQSALECAALLHERGAAVELLARNDAVRWLPDDTLPHAEAVGRAWRPKVPLPPTDVGGRLTGWAAATPDVFRRLPARVQPDVAFRCIRPAGSGWLRGRLSEVPVTFGVVIEEALEHDGEVTLRLADGSSRRVDHVLLGTGYRVDVRRYPFLDRDLADSIAVADGGYPVLGPGLESSVPGLHFMGAAAAHSFGPIMRFVVGTWYSAPAVARRVAGRRQPPVSFAF